MPKTVGTPSMIKTLNKNVIEEIIKTNGPVSKPEVAKLSKLSLVTVNKIVDLLLEENKVKVSGMHQNSVGRKAQYFVINEKSGHYIGLYYKDSQFIGVAADSIGKIVYETEFPVRQDSFRMLMEDTLSAVRKLQEECKDAPVLAVGIGVPGVVQDGCVSNIPKIPAWEGIDVAGLLEEELGISVYLENDINLVSMGVYYSDFQNEAENLLLAYLDQGIGSGIILNGKLFKGSTNFAGELGNLPVPEKVMKQNRPSRYRGHFERQLMTIAEELEHPSEELTEEKRAELKKTYLQIVAYGFLSVVCILNPEVIAIQCEKISTEDLLQLEKMMEECVGTEHMPWITKIGDIQKYGAQGAVNMCIRENSPGYILERRR